MEEPQCVKFPTHDEIALAAFVRWQANGEQLNDPATLDHWYEAEKELLGPCQPPAAAV